MNFLCFSDLIIEEAHKTMPSRASTSSPEVQVGEPEAGYQSGLFTGYRKKQKTNSCSSPLIQLNHYLDLCDGQNALQFWSINRNALPSLFKVTTRLMAIPASSAPVEHVFSHGGVIMRPHRSQMTDKVLSSLIFCKCNSL